jgi:hypothetical protein
LEEYNIVPKFLDTHSLKGLDEEILRKTQNAPKDEFGVTHDNFTIRMMTNSSVYWKPQIKRQ